MSGFNASGGKRRAGHQQTDRGRIVGTQRCGGQAWKALWTADPHLLVENAPGELAGAGKLAGARRSAPPGGRRRRRSRWRGRRVCTWPKISSSRAWMMRVSIERGTRSAVSSPLLAHLGERDDVGAGFHVAPAPRRTASWRVRAAESGAASMRARSEVTCWPPIGITSAWTIWPSRNTAMEVTPPPMSITVAPSCFSSSVSTAMPLA